MGKLLSCEFPGCNSVFTKKSELKKHTVEHKDPSRLYRCTECRFTTLDRRNLREHQNTHTNARPHKCNSCHFSSNGVSALCKHRKDEHPQLAPYSTKGSRKRKAADSRADTQAGVSYEHTPPTPSRAVSSYPQTLHSIPAHGSAGATSPASTEHNFSNNHSSAPGTYYSQGWNREPHDLTANSVGTSSLAVSQNFHASATVPMPSPVFQDSTNNAIVTSKVATYTPPMFSYTATSNAGSTSSGPVASYSNPLYNPESASSYSAFPTSNGLSNYTLPVRGEPSNNRAGTLAQGSVNINPNLFSQYNFVANRDVSAALPFLHNYAAASSRSSFYTWGTSIHSTQTPPVSRYSSLSGALGSESTSSASVTSCHTADSSLSPESYIDPSPSPSAESVPCDKDACAESVQVTPHEDGSKDNRHATSSTFPPAVEPVDALDTPHNSCASYDPVLLQSLSCCVPPVVPQEFIENSRTIDLNEYDSLSMGEWLEMETQEGGIFYQGTGREGCLCPEMMVDAGIEGWDKSVLKEL